MFLILWENNEVSIAIFLTSRPKKRWTTMLTGEKFDFD